jgi:hypothetical protein
LAKPSIGRRRCGAAPGQSQPDQASQAAVSGAIVTARACDRSFPGAVDVHRSALVPARNPPVQGKFAPQGCSPFKRKYGRNGEFWGHPKGRDEFCVKRAQLPFRSDDRCGQFNTLIVKSTLRQHAVVNVNSRE